MHYSDNATRWATGTPTIPGYLVARAGHDLIREIGVPEIREHSMRLTKRISDAALERGLTVNSPLDPKARTGWVGIDLPEAHRIVEELIERRVIVDFRPGCGIRVSAHFYTTDDDVANFFSELDALRR
jgi:kynureninase